MNFKEALEKDLSSVFFNANEFAEEHELEGETLDLVVEDTSLEELKGYGKDQLSAAQEVFSHFKTIFVRSSDFYVPKVGSILVLNGNEYYVEESAEDMGIIRILISANES
ncbi:hypothetical protein [Lysinibacillus sp. NPDC096212]|uniref:hypothetical protein n=1 Tax=Lysinibacillus sp. NPDC096212 TaxID=3364135 RepID=UPI00380D3510